MPAKTSPTPRRRGRPPVYAVQSTGGRVIKKYGNRRLYDTRDSRYINLEELMELFSSDRELKVVDAATGVDLTERTLKQAVLTEEDSGKSAILPNDLLRALVRYRRGAARTEFERHMARALAAFSAKRR